MEDIVVSTIWSWLLIILDYLEIACSCGMAGSWGHQMKERKKCLNKSIITWAAVYMTVVDKNRHRNETSTWWPHRPRDIEVKYAIHACIFGEIHYKSVPFAESKHSAHNLNKSQALVMSWQWTNLCKLHWKTKQLKTAWEHACNMLWPIGVTFIRDSMDSVNATGAPCMHQKWWGAWSWFEYLTSTIFFLIIVVCMVRTMSHI